MKINSAIRTILSGLAFILLPAVISAQPAYTISTIAGNNTAGFGGDGGPATSSELSGPFAVIADSSGNIYISDQLNNRIRKIASGNISTFAGNGTAGYKGDSGSASGAELQDPSGITLDSSGNMYIADTANFVVRKVAGGNISTVAGDNGIGQGFGGDGGAATSAELYNPSGVAVDSSGNLYIADPANNVVRIVNSGGTISTYAGVNSVGAGFSGDGGAVAASLLNNPIGVYVDSADNVYIVDSGNNVIRKVTKGIINTIVGNGVAGYSGDGGKALAASLNTPKGMAIDSEGNLYIADTVNCVIRLVTPNGLIFTIAGNQAAGPGYSGDGGAATKAQLYFPSGVGVNGTSVYIADNQNNVVRMLTAVPAVTKINSGGVITAYDFGAFPSVAPGSFIEIYGTDLAEVTDNWSNSFSGSNAPTSLDGTKVTVGGQSAYVAYVSPTQVNVQVPLNVPAGSQSLVLTNGSNTSTYSLTMDASKAGLWAPPNLNVGGQQYVGAFLGNSTTYVLPTGAVSGLTSQPAAPGDTIIMYGVGFGPVTPAVPAGQITSGQNSLSTPFQISIGGVAVTPAYFGLAPGEDGLYQFNLVVPANAPTGNAVPITFTLNGVPGTQTLFTAIAAAQ